MSQVVQKPPKKERSLGNAAGTLLLVQAIGLVATTFVLGIVWATLDWSMERGQALGVIWLIVMSVLGFLAWVTTRMPRPQEREPLFTAPQRRPT